MNCRKLKKVLFPLGISGLIYFYFLFGSLTLNKFSKKYILKMSVFYICTSCTNLRKIKSIKENINQLKRYEKIDSDKETLIKYFIHSTFTCLVLLLEWNISSVFSVCFSCWSTRNSHTTFPNKFIFTVAGSSKCMLSNTLSKKRNWILYTFIFFIFYLYLFLSN